VTSESDLLPQPPKGLKRDGKRVWKAVLEGFELRPDELLLLEYAARLADQVPVLEAEGRWTQARLHRLSVAKLLSQLSLSDSVNSAQARSDAGRRLIMARWNAR
jgi:hypothetical protein